MQMATLSAGWMNPARDGDGRTILPKCRAARSLGLDSAAQAVAILQLMVPGKGSRRFDANDFLNQSELCWKDQWKRAEGEDPPPPKNRKRRKRKKNKKSGKNKKMNDSDGKKNGHKNRKKRKKGKKRKKEAAHWKKEQKTHLHR
jgi:hypothetical protein